VPFVQGRLRDRDMTVVVDSECHHCSEALTLVIDNDMNVEVKTPGAQPIVFVPDVVPFDVDGPDIVDDF
jgi:hypothetical protein